MQTFLPYPNFYTSAESLDRQRLGKQRVEAYQILRTLLGHSQGWRNHPAVKMWRGHELTLYHYATIVCLEWRKRGYKDTVLEKLQELYSTIPYTPVCGPDWLGDPAFHRAHRANLVAKDPEFYIPKFGAVPFEPYVWPEEKADSTSSNT